MNETTLIWILMAVIFVLNFFLVFQIGKITALMKFVEETINEMIDELEEYETSRTKSGVASSTGLEETN